MLSQLFGKYLVEHKALSDDTLKNILKEQEGARVRLGTIAVADGLLTEAQADEINHLQTQMDKRFGDIAVEQKYLTENQVSTLLKKQGNSTMKFYQLLTDMAGLSLSKIDEYMNGFKSTNGFTDSELEALKEEDIEKLIPLFAATMNSMVTSLSGLVLRNLTRFVTSDFYPERMRKTKDYEYTVLAGQAIKGDHSLYLGFAAQNDMSGVIELAKGFAKEGNNITSDEVYDAVCEFCNLNNGLFASESSKNGIDIDMLPPEVYVGQKISGSAYVMPIVINNCHIDMIISVDESFRAGETAHNVEIIHKDSAGNADSSKGTVMIVDDSALIRKMLRAMLEKNGYAVTAEACNGEEAVQKYKENRADVVTLDITMPKMDGVAALKEIMAYDKDARVMMITAAGQQDKIVEALKSGALQFIMKPFNEEDVLKNFRDVLGK
ncbi:MAG: response regulator [Butyrivibrio crossotus]|nr:response regulator [Butyrivibrio crossotus]